MLLKPTLITYSLQQGLPLTPPQCYQLGTKCLNTRAMRATSNWKHHRIHIESKEQNSTTEYYRYDFRSLHSPLTYVLCENVFSLVVYVAQLLWFEWNAILIKKNFYNCTSIFCSNLLHIGNLQTVASRWKIVPGISSTQYTYLIFTF